MYELVRKGRRLYGAFLDIPSGLTYLAFRRPKDIFKDTKGKFVTISDAMADEKACWAIDESTLQEARRRGCVFVGFWVRRLNWVFLTNIENFLDPHKYFSRNYSSRGGELQRYLNLRYFTTRSRRLKI